MSVQPAQSDDKGFHVAKCRLCDPEALTVLRAQCHASLVRILLSRGASHTDAEDILADVWADCVVGADDRQSLLEKFSGNCTILGWLGTVATNRWLDLKRKQARRVDVVGLERKVFEANCSVGAYAATPSAKEDTLVVLLRESLESAFARCPARAKVLLRLVYLHGLRQRELCRMLGWSESKVSRFLARAMKQIEKLTLGELKKRDPWLELRWQDFVDLCETERIGFL